MSTSIPLTDRQRLRTTPASLAEKTKAKLPALNGRVEKACTLVLAGDVELHADGTALVGSLSDPRRAYQVRQGLCQCRDWGQAPEHLCCHRLAAGFLHKAEELLAAVPDGHVQDAPDGHVQAGADGPLIPRPQPLPEVHGTSPTPQPLPEAPASVNVRLVIDGRDCQLTLRDVDETRLLARLQAVLVQFPTPQPPAPAQPQGQLSPQQYNALAMHRPVTGVCPVHQVAMQLNQKDGRSWYSHKTPEGWCKSR
jgi:hypothetical protein